MYLHIGNNKSLRVKQIVGIFDLDSASVSSVTKKYLRSKEKSAMIVYAKEDLPKSFILTDDGRVYFSPISSSALLGRMTQIL